MKYSHLLVVLLVVVVAGCHARFKKFARKADTVDIQVIVSGPPQVDLVEGSGLANNTRVGAIAEAAVGIAQQAESVRVRKRLERVIRREAIEGMVQKGAVKYLGSGPPFGTAHKPNDGTVQVEVVNYGIVQSGGGPVFRVNYRVRVYQASDNRRVYNNSVSCSDRAFSTPNTPLNLAGTAATISYLEKTDDAELKRQLQAVVQRCTGSLISEMRKHAG